jgi:hypothetical protein
MVLLWGVAMVGLAVAEQDWAADTQPDHAGDTDPDGSKYGEEAFVR